MRQTFANLPENIENAINLLLAQQEDTAWLMRSSVLHERYTEREKGDGYIRDLSDVLAYLAMRVPATYAQLSSAFFATQEIIPSWQPKTILDIGSGPGTTVWAAQGIWPSLISAVCVDKDINFIQVGEKILSTADFPVTIDWKIHDVKRGLENFAKFDLVVLGNVLNELSVSEGEKLLGQAFNACNGLLVVVDSGTPFGYSIVQSVAKKLYKVGNLCAPYVNNSFVPSDAYWLHFPQRFIRPEFNRRVRQHMRDSEKMASDWEEAKYTYVAIGKMESEKNIWGRVVGPIKVQKGFLEVSILTNEKIEHVKVMKRAKKLYTFAKDLRWGDVIEQRERLVAEENK